VNHVKDQRIGIINTTFILVGPLLVGARGHGPLDPLNPALIIIRQLLCILLYRESSQASNRYEVRFRADSDRGLMLLQHKSSTVHGDFLAVSINHGNLEVSLNLGKEHSWDVRVLLSRVNVSDGQWHTISLARLVHYT